MARSRNRNQKRNQRVSRRRVQSRRNSQSRNQSRRRSKSGHRSKSTRRTKRVRRRSRGGSGCVKWPGPKTNDSCTEAQAKDGVIHRGLLCKNVAGTHEYTWQEATEEEKNADAWEKRDILKIC